MDNASFSFLPNCALVCPLVTQYKWLSFGWLRYLACYNSLSSWHTKVLWNHCLICFSHCGFLYTLIPCPSKYTKELKHPWHRRRMFVDWQLNGNMEPCSPLLPGENFNSHIEVQWPVKLENTHLLCSPTLISGEAWVHWWQNCFYFTWGYTLCVFPSVSNLPLLHTVQKFLIRSV